MEQGSILAYYRTTGPVDAPQITAVPWRQQPDKSYCASNDLTGRGIALISVLCKNSHAGRRCV